MRQRKYPKIKDGKQYYVDFIATINDRSLYEFLEGEWRLTGENYEQGLVQGLCDSCIQAMEDEWAANEIRN